MTALLPHEGRRRRIGWWRRRLRMLKRKLQDLTVCCTYKIDFFHQKAHSAKEFRRQYGVLDEIGRGGFGIVYKAVRISDSLPVAVKFVEHKHVREWTMTCNQLIPSELCHLETCRDIPGVIHLIDWFASSKGFLIVMERPYTCMDVFDLVSTYGRLDEATARGIFLQVVDTVCCMYAKHGLIHRDIKDENIIVDMETGEVKLVDFGATASAEKAMKKEFQGTRSYCPPEWFRQLQYLPLEATSWSLGVLLYILVTGQLPFKNEIQICLGRVKFPSYLTKECCQLIKSCLTTSASQRAGLADIRQHSWLNHPIPIHEKTFQEVLDITLGRSDSMSSKKRLDSPQDEEEYRQVNDVILTEDNHVHKTVQIDEEPQTAPTSPIARVRHRNQTDDECSLLTMATAHESQELTDSIRRLPSRYDNISASSLADYISLNSSLPIHDGIHDSISVATTGMYYSTSDINEEDDEESGISDLSFPVKSASAYNLANRARKRSMIFKSFDELGTVPEQSSPEHQPLVMTMSNSSSTSADEPTICEEEVSQLTSDVPETARVIASEEKPDDHINIEEFTQEFAKMESSTRPSRHRPLVFGAAGPSLSIFEAKSMAVN
ncbi:unnamed protein product [Auanema sp. JU1783]|nr:unnamed protein product [Auanema sp. JU1783]